MRKYMSVFLFVSLYLISFTAFGWTEIVNKPVAIVNGEIITLKEFEKESNPLIEQYLKNSKEENKEERVEELKKDILNSLIEKKILLQEAEKKNIKVTKVDVDKGMEEIKVRFDSKENFSAELKRQNITEKEFVKNVEESLIVNKLIEQEIKAKTKESTEEEINNYYQENKKDFEKPDQFQVRHIFIEVTKDADFKGKSRALNSIRDIERQLKEGADFIELAKKYSEDPGSRDKGGDIGFIAKGMMLKEFEEVLSEMKKGEMSGIVETDFGYHIIKLEDKELGKQLGLEDEIEIAGKLITVKDFIKETMLNKKLNDRFSEWLTNLKDTAKIETRKID